MVSTFSTLPRVEPTGTDDMATEHAARHLLSVPYHGSSLLEQGQRRVEDGRELILSVPYHGSSLLEPASPGRHRQHQGYFQYPTTGRAYWNAGASVRALLHHHFQYPTTGRAYWNPGGAVTGRDVSGVAFQYPTTGRAYWNTHERTPTVAVVLPFSTLPRVEPTGT